jgi:hypothetical protein
MLAITECPRHRIGLQEISAPYAKPKENYSSSIVCETLSVTRDVAAMFIIIDDIAVEISLV